MLLVSGENSIIAGGHAMTLIEQIVKIIYKDMGISEEQAKDSKEFKIMAMLLNSFVKHMGHDPKRLSRILISIVDQMERLHNDPSFSSAGPDLKLAKILKVFLESIGVVGIKMGQFLSAATVIKLPQELRDELKQLTDNAAPLDLASIFSILAAVGKGDVAIEMILGSASIKTSFKVKGTNRILKIKKLQVYYEALQDIVLLDNILKDMQEAGLITEKDRGFAVSEIRKMVEEESDFERERQNAKRLGENYDKRLDNSLYKIIYWVIGKILGIDKFAFHFSQVIDVIDNMIIEEEFIPGVSLKDYKGDDKRAIYLAVLVELLREVLFDKFFHADPHAGNILIGQGTEAAKINFIDMGDAGETSLKRGLATAAFLLIPILIDRFKLNPSSRMWILLNKISRSLEKDVHPSMVKFFGKITYLLEKPEVTIASAAHFSLFSKSNSHTGQGRADVFLIEGQKEFGVADTQRIQSLHVLTTIPPKDTDTNTTFTIRGPPGGEERIRLTQYIKDNLINAIFRSKSLHDGDFDEDIAIVLADKYDYIAGDHKDNNIIILNASDLEKMLAREEDPAFINELIVSILSEELAHERGADNNIAAEERLAEACASGTIGSFSDKQLREYIAFVGRNTRDMEGQYGYSTYLTQKGEDASARRLVENLPTIGRPPTITPESVEKGVELLKTQQKKLTVPNLAKVMGVNKYSLWLAHREGRIDLNRHGFRVKKIAERDTVTDENIGAAVQALQKEGIQQPGIEDIARALKVALSAIYSAQSKGVIHLERYDIAYNKDYASQGLITIENIARVIVDKKLKKPISIGQLTEALGVSDSAIRASIRRGRLSPKELQTLGVKIKQGTSLDVPFDDSIEQTYKSLRQAAESI